MRFTARDCRAKALECDKRASSANFYEVRIQRHEMAQQWRSMAEQLERMAAREAGEPERYQLSGSASIHRGRAGR